MRNALAGCALRYCATYFVAMVPSRKLANTENRREVLSTMPSCPKPVRPRILAM